MAVVNHAISSLHGVCRPAMKSGFTNTVYTCCSQWRIQNFIVGADGRMERSGEGAVPLPRKKWILPETGGFWCNLWLLFYVYAKLVRSMGASPRPSPLNPPLATAPTFITLMIITWISLRATKFCLKFPARVKSDDFFSLNPTVSTSGHPYTDCQLIILSTLQTSENVSLLSVF